LSALRRSDELGSIDEEAYDPGVTLVAWTGVLSPGAGLFVYTLLVFVVVVCAGLCAAKGRWGYLLAGAVTLGIFWIVGATRPAMSGSVWARILSARQANH
jgi:hypothetical protein